MARPSPDDCGGRTHGIAFPGGLSLAPRAAKSRGMGFRRGVWMAELAAQICGATCWASRAFARCSSSFFRYVPLGAAASPARISPANDSSSSAHPDTDCKFP